MKNHPQLTGTLIAVGLTVTTLALMFAVGIQPRWWMGVVIGLASGRTGSLVTRHLEGRAS